MGIDIDFNDLLSESDERIDCSDFPVAWMVYTEDGKSVYVTDNPEDIKPGQRALPLFTRPDTSTCTCHPDDNPPVPCARRYALSECRKTAPPAPADVPISEQVKRMARDAARYRWLRDNPWPDDLSEIIEYQCNARWDTAIDEAMKGASDES